MRAIDGDALTAKLGIGHDCSVCEHNDTPFCEWKPNAVDICEAIYEAPTINPVRKGKWIKGTGENGVSTSLFCSECNYENRHWYEWDYCPNCGAKMEEGEKE